MQIDHFVRISYDGSGIRGYEGFSLTNTDHQWACFSGCDECITVSLFDDSDGIGSLHLCQSLFYGLIESAMVGIFDIFDQLHQYLRVCLGGKLPSMLDQCFFQYGIVLYRAIVHEGYLSSTVITSVFQSVLSLNEHIECSSIPYVTYDSAHNIFD